MKKEKNQTTKTINYLVRVNNTFYEACPSLRLARECIKNIPKKYEIEDSNFTIDVVKQVIQDTVMNTYSFTETKILISK